MNRLLLITIFVFLSLTGCSSIQEAYKGNPTPKDFLSHDNADIFMYEGIVYSNVEGVEWVLELDYTIGEQVLEIKKQKKKAFGFRNGTANKLPIGTVIYETNTPVYIVIINGEEIPYLAMIEG
ncbi:hypothetical protein M3152_10190 [Sporosarcina luteola]|uniref:hypothetical protein n=1 Tax=Sporosarcina luteola TaxID=582850 RepID=UPI00203E62E3|nr:hypothetical protein [Sporosarcina luteola]MCM3638095.1 hypothetical protein [Sporosarcina luteola]